MENIEKLYNYWQKNKHIPSYSKLCEIFWVSSKSMSHKIAKKLIEEWYLEKIWNSLIPTEKFTKNWSPWVWEIRAWFPSPAEQFDWDRLNLDDYLIEDPNDTILVNVKGDSMEDFWINQWDIVIVKRWASSNIWDIVIAEVDWEFTLKKLSRQDWKYFLETWNKKYPPIFAEDELKIHWRVVWLVRKY